MSDERELNANVNTQSFTGSSTVEQYDYQVPNSEFGSLAGTQFNFSWKENNTSIQICLRKLNALDNTNINQTEVDNCFKKMVANFDSYI